MRSVRPFAAFAVLAVALALPAGAPAAFPVNDVTTEGRSLAFTWGAECEPPAPCVDPPSRNWREMMLVGFPGSRVAVSFRDLDVSDADVRVRAYGSPVPAERTGPSSIAFTAPDDFRVIGTAIRGFPREPVLVLDIRLHLPDGRGYAETVDLRLPRGLGFARPVWTRRGLAISGWCESVPRHHVVVEVTSPVEERRRVLTCEDGRFHVFVTHVARRRVRLTAAYDAGPSPGAVRLTRPPRRR